MDPSLLPRGSRGSAYRYRRAATLSRRSSGRGISHRLTGSRDLVRSLVPVRVPVSVLGPRLPSAAETYLRTLVSTSKPYGRSLPSSPLPLKTRTARVYHPRKPRPNPLDYSAFDPFFKYAKNTMAPAVLTNVGASSERGPHPSYIQVSKQYLFHQQIQGQLVAIGGNVSREDIYRLQGVQWIDDVRTALQLPVRTFTTASVYYHKFRLMHKDNEYQYQDAAAAALLSACKIEDTLKKSREILAAAHNIKVSPSEHLSSDDVSFEQQSRVVIGIERLMFEAAAFDFRGRYPHKVLIKIVKAIGMEKDVAKVAWAMLMDLYKTFAPVKQTSFTLALACVKLTTLIEERQQEIAPSPEKYYTTEGEVMETVIDLLDLYTHFQKSSNVGPRHVVEKFIQLRIKLNQEMNDSGLARYTNMLEPSKNGFKSNVKTPKTPITPASPAETRANGRDVNSPATMSPRSSGSGRRGAGARGQDGTVRFMQDAVQAKQEKEVVSEYFKDEYEEYEVEVEEPIKPERPSNHHQGHHQGHHHHRNDRFHNKRVRR